MKKISMFKKLSVLGLGAILLYMVAIVANSTIIYGSIGTKSERTKTKIEHFQERSDAFENAKKEYQDSKEHFSNESADIPSAEDIEE